jgi:UDP-4-amino-4,6-dideoxy-N-acetyl-beta-L-altrosamine transaminase
VIPYGHQSLDDSDIEAVLSVLKSDFLTQGGVVPAFERAVCEYVGAKFGVATNSGTSALHIACLALELSENDILWTTPITFVASANCGLFCGARVDFVDINGNTGNIDVTKLREKLVLAEKRNRLPKVLVIVHLAGMPADLVEIQQLARQYGIRTIEDASHALGATYHNFPVGNGHFSDVTIFSFHPVKPITTAEGGMAVTNDKTLANQMRLLASHGITRDEALMDKATEGPWYYQQIALGYNYRMSDIHAALGISQLSRIDLFIEKRRQIAHRYDQNINNLPLQLPVKFADRSSGYHLYSVLLDDSLLDRRKQIFEALREKEIGVNVHYIPVHLQPYYQSLGFRAGDFPVAETYYQRALTLPCFPDLTSRQQDYVIEALHEVVSD